jgi:hypothetical protein
MRIQREISKRRKEWAPSGGFWIRFSDGKKQTRVASL